MSYAATAQRASYPLGPPKPKLLDRVLTPAPHVPEIGYTISQPISLRADVALTSRTECDQPVTAQAQMHAHGNRLQPPAALKEIDRSAYL